MNVGEQFTGAVEVCPMKSDGGHQLLQGEVTKLHLKHHPSDEVFMTMITLIQMQVMVLEYPAESGLSTKSSSVMLKLLCLLGLFSSLS